MPGTNRPAIGQQDRIAIGKSRAGPQQDEPTGLELTTAIPGKFRDEPRFAPEECRHIHGHRLRLDAPGAGGFDAVTELGGMQECLCRHAPAQNAQAAQLRRTVNHRGPCATRGQGPGGGIPGTASTDHHGIEFEIVHEPNVAAGERRWQTRFTRMGRSLYDPSMPADPALLARVTRIVNATPVRDIHTHLYDPAFGALLLWGIDELLIYHYLVAEGFRHLDIPYDQFWAAGKSAQTEMLWNALFVQNSPVSESCRGVLTTLQALGIDARKNDLASIRRWFSQQRPDQYMERVLELANIQSICMTNSPFDDEERPLWEQGFRRDPRFVAALRIDPLLVSWNTVAPRLKSWGYEVAVDFTGKTADEVRRFLADWTRRLDARYCMVSLPPTFTFPAQTDTAWLIEHAVLPHCRDHGQAFALMMGVKRAVNPQLQLAGDGVGRSDLNALQQLCAGFPSNKFLVTCLARENQHELVVLARKFRNLHPFGCWWFTNTPQLIDEITRMRLELLGTSFTPQHSDARVLDQVIYKWSHSRALIARCLADRYADLAAAGWPVSDVEIQRDCGQLLGGAFAQFCGR